MMAITFNRYSMRVMRRLALFLLPLLLFVGCQKDEVTLKAVIQNFGDEKVHLNSEDYAIFDNGDRVYLKAGNQVVSNGVAISVASGGAATIASAPSASSYVSVFPYSSDGKVKLGDVQEYQTVTVNGIGVQKIIAPMAAKNNANNVLVYKNMCSLLEVKVKAPVANFYVHNITVTSSSTDLWGTYDVNWSDGTPSLSGPLSGSSHGRAVTLDCKRYLIANQGDEKVFYVVVPPFESSQLAVHVQGFAPRAAGSDRSGSLYFYNNQMSEQFRLPASQIIRGLTVGVSDFHEIEGLEGEGTEVNPYKLYNYQNLYYAAQVVNAGEVDQITSRHPETFKTGTFWVMNDIDCGESTVLPIGTQVNRFEGVFDGQGNTVTYNKLADLEGNIGLIGNLANGATIKDLTVAGNITVDHVYGRQVNVIGGIVGGVCCQGVSGTPHTTLIRNCHNQATIGAPDQRDGVLSFTTDRSAHVGGVVGAIWRSGQTDATEMVSIENCTNSGNIDGFISDQQKCGTGGILGSCINKMSVVINNCSNSGRITNRSKRNADDCGAGGICGVLYGSDVVKIINCENTGEVTNINTVQYTDKVALGGICGVWGFNTSGNTLANCVNHAAVTHQNYGTNTGNGYAGGILGSGNQSNLRVSNCYSDGTVSGCADSRMGGIAGSANNENIISGCYYSGANRERGNVSVAGNQIGAVTSYSALLGILNTWVNGNSATPAYSTWVTVSGKPELSSLQPTSTTAKTRR